MRLNIYTKEEIVEELQKHLSSPMCLCPDCSAPIILTTLYNALNKKALIYFDGNNFSKSKNPNYVDLLDLVPELDESCRKDVVEWYNDKVEDKRLMKEANDMINSTGSSLIEVSKDDNGKLNPTLMKDGKVSSSKDFSLNLDLKNELIKQSEDEQTLLNKNIIEANVVIKAIKDFQEKHNVDFFKVVPIKVFKRRKK